MDASTWKFKVKSMVKNLPFNSFEFPIKSMESKYKGKFFKLKNRNAMVQGYANKSADIQPQGVYRGTTRGYG